MIKLKIKLDEIPIFKARFENVDELDDIFKAVKQKLGGKK